MNFSIQELTYSSNAAKYHIRNVPDEVELHNLYKLISSILQPIMDKFGAPIRINSGYRCKELNKLVGGSNTSQHLKGEAADVTSDDNVRLWNIIIDMIKNKEITVGQLIDEKNLTWIHISLGEKNQILHL